MIEISFITKNEFISGFIISGHADKSGKEFGEIVCAGVSATTQVIANGLEKVCNLNETDFKIKQKDGYTFFEILDNHRIKDLDVITLMQTLKLGLEEMQKVYSDYIEIK